MGVRFKTFFEPTNVDYQFWFWKHGHTFLFLTCSHLEPFLGPLALFLGLGSGSKSVLGPTYIDYQLWIWKYSHNFLFLISQFWGPYLPFLGPSGLLFGFFGAIFWDEIRLKNIFGTYVGSQILFWKYSTRKLKGLKWEIDRTDAIL